MKINELILEAISTAKFGNELYTKLATLLPVKQEGEASRVDVDNFFKKFRQVFDSWSSEQYWNQEPEKSNILRGWLKPEYMPMYQHGKRTIPIPRLNLGHLSSLYSDGPGIKAEYDPVSHKYAFRLTLSYALIKNLLENKPEYQYTALREIVDILVHELTHFIQHTKLIKKNIKDSQKTVRRDSSRKSLINKTNDPGIRYLGARTEISARANQWAFLALRELKKAYMRNSNRLSSQDVIDTLKKINSWRNTELINPKPSFTDERAANQYQKVRQRLLKQAYQIIMNTMENHPEYMERYFNAPWGTGEEIDSYDPLMSLVKDLQNNRELTQLFLDRNRFQSK